MSTASFSRDTVALRMDGSSVGINSPRYEQGKFGQAVMLDNACINDFVSPTDFNTASWSKVGATAPQVSMIGPMGNTITANKLTETAITDYHYTYQYVGKSATSEIRTATIYAKAGERTSICVKLNGTGAVAFYTIYVDLLTGLVSNPTRSGFTTGTNLVTPIGDGWYRISLTVTSDITITLALSVFLQNTTLVYLGDITKGAYIYTAQMELSANPTSFAVGFRQSEVLSIPSTIINPNEGTIACWVKMVYPTVFFAPIFTSYPSGSIASMFGVYKQPNQNMLSIYYGNGIGSSSVATATLSKSLFEWNHIVLTYKVGETYKLFVNGVFVKATTAVALQHVFGPSFLLGNQGGSYIMGGLMDDFRAYGTIMSDSFIYDLSQRQL